MTETTQAEIWMYAVRLMRSGRYRKAKEVITAVAEEFPNVTAAEVAQSLARLADKLKDES